MTNTPNWGFQGTAPCVAVLPALGDFPGIPTIFVAVLVAMLAILVHQIYRAAAESSTTLKVASELAWALPVVENSPRRERAVCE